VLVRARGLLLQAASLQQHVRLLKKGEQGRLAFGVGPAMPGLFLPELLVRINQELPALSVDVTVEAISQLVELLRQELIEFSVLVPARGLLLQAASLQQHVRLLKKGEQGRLAFGVGPAMPGLFLPELLVRINQELPALSVDVTVEAISQLVELLRQELIEFFV